MRNSIVKGWARLMILAMVAMVAMVSCNDDPDPDPPILVEDGFYIMGEGTGLTVLNGDGLMTQAKNEVGQEPRATLYEKYVAVEAGSAGFNIVSVVGGQSTNWGPGADFAKVAEDDLDVEEPKNGIWRGGYTTSDAAFTVEEDGLYHVAIDTELGIVMVARVVWGLIGGATPGGWSTDTPMEAQAFDKNTMIFSVEEVTMLESAWKFRYSGGWKVFMDTEGTVKVNANFGGALDALEAGGADISNEVYAVYKFDLTWSLTDGISAVQTKTGDAEPLPEYPEELYMVGASIGGWDWDANGVQLNPIHSHANAFWRIVWIEAGVADAGIKFAPQKAWSGDFGIADDTQPGVGDHLVGSSNVPDVAASGYYMVWVDLERDSISIAEPEVYLIGDAVGGVWDAPQTDYMFTVDNANEVITLTKDIAAGNLRMHAWHKWHYDWWQHEFNIIGGNIEYRGTGGDQEAVPVSAGATTIDLNFKTGTGTITQ